MELLTREQAAERLGISVSTLDNERVAGNLEYIQRKRYGKVWITEEAIKAYLARGTHSALPEKPARITSPYQTYREQRKRK